MPATVLAEEHHGGFSARQKEASFLQNPEKTNEKILYAILGSEPRIGENSEVSIPQSEVKNLVYSEPVKL